MFHISVNCFKWHFYVGLIMWRGMRWQKNPTSLISRWKSNFSNRIVFWMGLNRPDLWIWLKDLCSLGKMPFQCVACRKINKFGAKREPNNNHRWKIATTEIAKWQTISCCKWSSTLSQNQGMWIIRCALLRFQTTPNNDRGKSPRLLFLAV